MVVAVIDPYHSFGLSSTHQSGKAILIEVVLLSLVHEWFCLNGLVHGLSNKDRGPPNIMLTARNKSETGMQYAFSRT